MAAWEWDDERMTTATCPRTGRLLAGRTVLITGVLRPTSIATAVADCVVAQGGGVILTTPGRARRLTQAVVESRGWEHKGCDVVDLDLTDGRDVTDLAPALKELGVTGLDGIVHAVAHAAPALLGDSVLPTLTEQTPGDASWQDWQRQLAETFAVSVASLPALVAAARPLLRPGGDVVALTFASDQVAAGYGWMGPMKAALEAAVRALAVELGPAGIRVNAVSAGPLRTPAASAIPGFSRLAANWQERAVLGWEAADRAGVATTVTALLAGILPATTGQVLAADGGARLSV